MIRALLFLSLFGCTGAKLAAVRTTVSQQTGCPEPQLQVKEHREGWYATGCETRYFCQATDGPCSEDPTDAQRLAKARAVFSKESACNLADVSITLEPRGYGASGCGRYAVCAEYNGPCMPAVPPTCAELAKWRLDTCTTNAMSQAERARDRNRNYSSRRSIANSIVGTVTANVRENDAVEACKAQHDAERRVCPP